jgi:small subunit ribosomal protein S9
MANDNSKYIYAVGRRKTSTATVRLYEGEGENMINERKVSEIYTSQQEVRDMLLPLEVTGNKGKFYFTAKASSGGKAGQRGAVRLAIARALVKKDEANKPELKKYKLLTRDDRMVERKKSGLRKARKAPQYSKR